MNKDLIYISSKFEKSTGRECFDKRTVVNHLEDVIGNYMFSKCDTDLTVGRLYYDASINPDTEDIPEIEKNLIAYIFFEESVIFVKPDYLEQIENDTSFFKFEYIQIESFEIEILCVDINRLPTTLNTILWVNDDFLYDEDMVFDDAAFAIIDSGMEYLNPNHFSVKNLARQYVNKNAHH